MVFRRTLALLAPLLAGFVGINAAAAQTAASPYTTGFRTDVAGRPAGTIGPDPDGSGALRHAATRTTYNAQGLVAKMERGWLSTWQSETVAPSAWTGFTVVATVEFSYDHLGRKVQERTVDGGVVVSLRQFSYDSYDRLVCSAVRMNPAEYGSLPTDVCTPDTPGAYGADRITRNSYDNRDRVTKIEKAVGTNLHQAYATYTFNAADKPLTLVDANGNLTRYQYDGFERRTHWFFPSKTTVGQSSTTDYEQYGYDANGNRTSLRKRSEAGQTAGSHTLTFTYDALNRMTAKIVPGRSDLSAAQTRDVYYAYDLRGLQTQAKFDSLAGDGLTTLYDGFGRIKSSALKEGSVTRTLSYEYDANGNRTRITHPDGKYFTYEYLGSNAPRYVRENGSTVVLTFSYDSAGRRTILTTNNGLSSSSPYEYDGSGRLKALSHNLVNSDRDVRWDLTYNPASQTHTRTMSNDNYAYSDVDVNRSYGVNGLNQYTAAGPASFTYDLNGNLTGSTTSTPSGPVTTNYLYDHENRLVAATGAAVANLAYDPLGRLLQTSGGSAGTTQFLYDGDALVAEYDGSGTLLRRYVHGPGIDEPLLWYEGTATVSTARRYMLANTQGSIVAIADAAGASLGINSYDAWGIPAATNLGRFAYTGQIRIPELGLYHYKARIYSPTLGRFLQTDPIGYEDQVNLYAYVGNDPVNVRDPSGRQRARPLPVPGTLPMPGVPTPSDRDGNGLYDQDERAARSLQSGLGSAAKGAAQAACTGSVICLIVGVLAEAVDDDGVIIPEKIQGQMGERGWTEEEIQELATGERDGTSVDNTRDADGNRREDPASVYGDRDDYIVVNDRTREVVQVSDKNNPHWKPDPRIRWDH